MKKLLPVFVFIITAGCSPYGNIRVIHDDYAMTKVIMMELRERTEESDVAARGYLKFVRVLGKDTESACCLVRIQGKPGSENLTARGFLKIDGSTVPVAVANSSAAVKSETRTVKSVNMYMGRTDISTVTSDWVELKGKCIITPEIRDRMLSARKMLVRVYSGPVPVTVEVPERSMERVKALLKHTGLSEE